MSERKNEKKVAHEMTRERPDLGYSETGILEAVTLKRSRFYQTL